MMDGKPGRDWSQGVRVARGGDFLSSFSPTDGGRWTAFDFDGRGGTAPSVSVARLPPGLATGKHHHGHHELAIYVVHGESEISWGENLEFSAVIRPGDFAYFAPFVPHQEKNVSDDDYVEFVVVRSAADRIVVKL